MIVDKKRGVSLIGVLIVLVVMSILVGIISISMDGTLDNTYKREFIREYKLVKACTNDYVMRNSGVIDFVETELDLSTIPNKYLSQFEGETIVNNKIAMYIIDLEKVGVSNPTYGTASDENDIYLLSKNKLNVYYKEGFEDNGTIYYKAIED